MHIAFKAKLYPTQLTSTHLDRGVHHEIKQLAHSQRGHARAPEEVVRVLAVCREGL